MTHSSSPPLDSAPFGRPTIVRHGVIFVRRLRELATTRQKADGGSGGRLLAEALSRQIEVLGSREATIHIADEAVAHGFAAVIRDRLDVTIGYGRGERAGSSGTRQIRGCTVVMWGQRPPLDLTRSA